LDNQIQFLTEITYFLVIIYLQEKGRTAVFPCIMKAFHDFRLLSFLTFAGKKSSAYEQNTEISTFRHLCVFQTKAIFSEELQLK